MADLLGTRLPIVAAPMAGGPTTPQLVAAVTRAGGFGLLAAGYRTAEAMSADIAALRALGVEHFGVNLFVPRPSGIDEPTFRRYAEELAPEARRFGLDLSREPLREDDDQWQAKVDALVADPVPIVSLTFAVPSRDDIGSLQEAGSRVLITVTTVAEAHAAREAGVDGLVVQGSAAGGHSGTHDPTRPIEPIATADLVRAVVDAVDLPVIAGGGVDGPPAVRELREAGAEAVAVGTLLLRTDESGASQVHKDALAGGDFTETVITKAFTGRPARGLRNAFIDAHEDHAPIGYPAIHHLTRGIRQAAVRAEDAQRVHLWAGIGFRHAPIGSAEDLVQLLGGR